MTKVCAICGKTVSEFIDGPRGPACKPCLQKLASRNTAPSLEIGIEKSALIGQKTLNMRINGAPVVRQEINAELAQSVGVWLQSLQKLQATVSALREDNIYLMGKLGMETLPAHFAQKEFRCTDCEHHSKTNDRERCDCFTFLRVPHECIAFSKRGSEPDHEETPEEEADRETGCES